MNISRGRNSEGVKERRSRPRPIERAEEGELGGKGAWGSKTHTHTQVCTHICAHTCTHNVHPGTHMHSPTLTHTYTHTHTHPRWHLSQSGRSLTARSRTFQLAGLQAAPRLHPIFLVPKLPNSHHPLSSDGLFHPKSGSWAKFTELLRDRRMPLVTRTEFFPWHVCPLGKLPILGSGPWPPIQGPSSFHEQKGDSKIILWRDLEKHGFKAVR